MTTGLEKFSNYYLNLITSFPPRPISNEQELIATQKQINKILDIRIFESEAVVLDILEGKIKITDEEFNQLKNNYL